MSSEQSKTFWSELGFSEKNNLGLGEMPFVFIFLSSCLTNCIVTGRESVSTQVFLALRMRNSSSDQNSHENSRRQILFFFFLMCSAALL